MTTKTPHTKSEFVKAYKKALVEERRAKDAHNGVIRRIEQWEAALTVADEFYTEKITERSRIYYAGIATFGEEEWKVALQLPSAEDLMKPYLPWPNPYVKPQ